MMLYILNILDLILTLHAVSHGGTELNPLMRSVPVMIAYKVVVVGALCWWLRKRKVNLWPVTAVYGAVNAWHIWNQIILIGVIL